jgi:ABC-type sugar transport system ATPase subunit
VNDVVAIAPAPLAAARSPLIETRDVCRTFGALKALTDVSLTFRRGEVHGLVGPNGAGKSTFLNIVGGIITPTSGSIFVDGVETEIRGPAVASALGFSFIPQELSLVPDFSTIDNITLGLGSISRGGFVDRAARDRLARQVAERIGIAFDLHKPIRSLSPAERGLVAIGHALAHDMRFIAMDEPTASLSDVECQRLFQVVRELARDGVTVAYVSHRLAEIEELCDRVTVFRDGRVVARFDRGEYTRADLLRGITGSEAGLQPLESALPDVATTSRVLLTVEHLSDGNRVKDVSFEVREGEIVGLAGLVGSGRTETFKLVIGDAKLRSGRMTLNGRDYRPHGIPAAIAAGVALVPEERRSQGLLMESTIADNIALGGWAAMRVRPPAPLISEGRPRAVARRMVEALSIKTKGVDEPVRRLSGGNQQKVVFGRWLSRDAQVLLLDEPTRGVDVGARQQIWATVEKAAAEGKGVAVISSELGELVLCHRVFVIVEGRTVAELTGPGVTEEQVLAVTYRTMQQQEAE